MPWSIIIRIVAVLTIFRLIIGFLFRRTLVLVVWLVLLLAAVFLLLPALHVHAQEDIVAHYELLSPTPVHVERLPLGIVRRSTVILWLPALTAHAHAMLAADPQGLDAIHADDIIQVTLTPSGQQGITHVFSFDRPDGRGVAPGGPFDLGPVSGRSIQVTTALLDIQPPRTYGSAIWLVIRAPHPAPPPGQPALPSVPPAPSSDLPSHLSLRLAALAGLLCAALGSSLVLLRRRGQGAVTARLWHDLREL